MVYALLSHKKKETYSRFYKIIKDKIVGWNLENTVMDFEVAAILALKSSFPIIMISGCNYHFNQYIWRKVQEMETVTEVQVHVKMCSAQAYMPLDKVDGGWLNYENSPPHKKLSFTITPSSSSSRIIP